jgi:hypothetical protein
MARRVRDSPIGMRQKRCNLDGVGFHERMPDNSGHGQRNPLASAFGRYPVSGNTRRRYWAHCGSGCGKRGKEMDRDLRDHRSRAAAAFGGTASEMIEPIKRKSSPGNVAILPLITCSRTATARRIGSVWKIGRSCYSSSGPASSHTVTRHPRAVPEDEAGRMTHLERRGAFTLACIAAGRGRGDYEPCGLPALRTVLLLRMEATAVQAGSLHGRALVSHDDVDRSGLG